jgi:hypothetical protein
MMTRNHSAMLVRALYFAILAITQPIVVSQSSWWPPNQLSGTADCIAAGLDPVLSQYRQTLLLPNTYQSPSIWADRVFAPVFASVPLLPSSPTDKDLDIKLAVIYIHGLQAGECVIHTPISFFTRISYFSDSVDANAYFCDGM